VRRVVCASPAYLRGHGVPGRPEDLAAHRCVRFTGLTPHAEWTFRGRPTRIAVNSVLTCNQVDAAVDACVRGLGLGCFLSYMVAPHVRAGRLRYVLEAFEVEPSPVTFVYPQSRVLSPTVRAFANLCSERLRRLRFD
jgi:DNA-binding transcriptional LysR family regulator